MKIKNIIISLTLFCVLTLPSLAQAYKFTDVKILPATPVKNQARTGTCWCFSSISFIESELLRTGKGEHDLSEMYVVRNNYIERLQDNYLRMGKGNIDPGSISHMATKVIAKYGIVPEEVYSGINYNSPTHNHTELSNYIGAIAEQSVKMKQRSPEYHKLMNSVLDIYLGEVPAKFNYKGKEYTPETFAKSLGLNMDDYIEFTSFSHHPFYQAVPLEIPDNWDNEKLYNVPLDDIMRIMNHAFENGYTVNWDGDISERGFVFAKHVAINPEINDLSKYSAADREKFATMSPPERLAEVLKLEKIYPEIDVTQEIRQRDFEAFISTDDHLMHLTGIVKDQNGTIFYVTKNSWGTERNGTGYLNMSESYVRAKTISIILHKDGVPSDIKKKFGL